MIQRNENIRNIAIIAHVDHGKTTLVDAMFQQSGLFRQNEEVAERLMDSGDLEKERGITISAKNCEVRWDGIRINILDTPGHADFGGEVERALSMVDGVVLLVDAAEGPLPQTRFVMSKAMDLGLELILVINKIDRQDARPEEVYHEVLELLIDLGADDHHMESPVIYANGRAGIALKNPRDEGRDLKPLMETILKIIPGPAYEKDAPFQMLAADLDYSDYLGKMTIGRIRNGALRMGQPLVCIGEDGVARPVKVSQIQVYRGPRLEKVSEAEPGEIVILSGSENISIGDTLADAADPRPLPRITVDEPTVAMRFTTSNSPLLGKEGKYVQSSRLGERLRKEALRNVALQVEDAPDGDGFILKGRGEFQMAIIIETLRREDFEFCVGRPEVIFHTDESGKKQEPMEHLMVDIEEAYSGAVSEALMQRKGLMEGFHKMGGGRVRLEFSIPSRGLIGYRDQFLTTTKGTGLMNSYLQGYGDYRGDFPSRKTGSLVADRSGQAVAYALFNLEPRGRLFIVPGDAVYEGMVVGEHSLERDLDVNPTKMKQLSNMRAAGKDDNVVLTPVTPLSIEGGLNFLRDDEFLEVTPLSIRLRKRILTKAQRKVRTKESQG